MKAISLWQPWASLIAADVKPYETRDWAPPAALIGQRIAICAAKKVDPDAARMAHDLLRGRYDADAKCDVAHRLRASWSGAPSHLMARFGVDYMPAGAVVCTARLRAAFQLGEPAIGTPFLAMTVDRTLASTRMPPCFTVRVDPFGNYAQGRWAWLLDEMMVCRPLRPVIGRQKLFDLPLGWKHD